MSRHDDEFRRAMSRNLPTGPYRMADQVATVRDITPRPKTQNYMLAGGVWMIQDGNRWRPATSAEIEKVGTVICMPTDCAEPNG